MSKLLDLYNSFNGAGLQNDWTKAKTPVLKDQTPYSKGSLPGKEIQPPFGNADDAVLTPAKLKSARSGELGSNPKPLVGYNMPGYAPGDNEYSKKMKR